MPLRLKSFQQKQQPEPQPAPAAEPEQKPKQIQGTAPRSQTIKLKQKAETEIQKRKPEQKTKKEKDEPEFLLDSLGRKHYPHKYKYGIPDEPITEEELAAALEKGYFSSPLEHRSYLQITGAIGARRTEPLAIIKEDIEEHDGFLYVKIPAKKHGKRGGVIELPLEWMRMDLVKEQWQKTRKGKTIWNFSSWTAWRIVKRVFPTKSNHHLRWTFITKLRVWRDQGKITTDDIKSWTGIKRDSTIEGYGLKTQAGIHKISQLLNQKKDQPSQ